MLNVNKIHCTETPKPSVKSPLVYSRTMPVFLHILVQLLLQMSMTMSHSGEFYILLLFSSQSLYCEYKLSM